MAGVAGFAEELFDDCGVDNAFAFGDAMADEIPFEPITYDLFVGFELEQMSLVSYAGLLDAGERLLTNEGVWQIRDVMTLTGGVKA